MILCKRNRSLIIDLQCLGWWWKDLCADFLQVFYLQDLLRCMVYEHIFSWKLWIMLILSASYCSKLLFPIQHYNATTEGPLIRCQIRVPKNFDTSFRHCVCILFTNQWSALHSIRYVWHLSNVPGLVDHWTYSYTTLQMLNQVGFHLPGAVNHLSSAYTNKSIIHLVHTFICSLISASCASL